MNRIQKALTRAGHKDLAKELVKSADVYDTHTQTTLDDLESKGFKIKFDGDKGKGTAVYKGLKFIFHIGGENIYFKLPEFYFSDDAGGQGPTAVKLLLKEINNYGGFSK